MTILLTILICTLSAAFFAGLESGLVSTDRFLLESEDIRNRLSVRSARFLLAKPERLLSTTLIGTNIAVVTAGIVLNGAVRTSSAPYLSVPVSLSLSLLLLIFSEIIPKSYFRRKANTVTVKLSIMLIPFYLIFLPLAIILNTASRLIMILTGQAKSSHGEELTKQDLRMHVRLEGVEAGISIQDQMLVEDIFDFQETMAREVMSQIHEMPVCRINQPIQEVAEYALSSRTEIIPICDQRIEDILGYVDINDLFKSPDSSIRSLLKETRIYPDTKRIPQLLAEMNRTENKVVFLSNEYGRITGLLTPEHIVSEIIGYSPGAPESKDKEIETIEPGVFRVSGIIDIEDFQNEVRVRIPKGAYDTIGGFICDRLGRIPTTGETFDLRNPSINIRIEESEPTHIVTLIVHIRR